MFITGKFWKAMFPQLFEAITFLKRDGRFWDCQLVSRGTREAQCIEDMGGYNKGSVYEDMIGV